MRNTIEIRRLTQDDIDHFFTLRLEALQTAPSSFLASYEDEKKLGASSFANCLDPNNSDNVIFGAFMDHHLVGCIGLYRELKIKIAHKSKLWGMFVQEKYRNQGIGKRLLKNAIQYAHNNFQSKIIHLTVESTNHQAKKLYEACGFKAWGNEPLAMKINGRFYEECHMALVTD